MATNNPTKVITGKVRFSYVTVFEPKSMDGTSEREAYSCVLLIPKSDKKTIAAINKAVEEAKLQGKNSKFGGKIPAAMKLPLRDGDAERPDDDSYSGMYFVNAKAYNKPGLVDKDLNPIIDREEFYSGCWGRASVNFYPYNVNGSKGIACGLNNLQKLAEGDRLAGGSDAETDFAEAFEDDDLM